MTKQTKECIICGKVFEKPSWCRGKRWDLKKCCSAECQLKTCQGWNKGLTNYLSPEARQVMAENARRNIAKETPEQAKSRGQKALASRIENGIWTNGRLGKTGDQDPNWLGDDATYNAKHKWIHKHWDKTGVCEDCGITPVAKKVTRLKNLTQWHNISGLYKRDRADWLELCTKCHYKRHH